MTIRAELDVRVAGEVVTVPIKDPDNAVYEGWQWLRAHGYPVATTFEDFIAANARAATGADDRLSEVAVRGTRRG